MMKKIALLIGFSFAITVHAQSQPASMPGMMPAVMPSSMPAVTSETMSQKTMVCAACHGEKGVSTNPIWPNLAGQHAGYLVMQLEDFKSNRRAAPSMAAMVANLTNEDILAIANYYAAQQKAIGTTPKQYLSRGEAIYRGGDLKKHITACIACHGPNGDGNRQADFPMVSGQHAEYLVQQLQAFANGTRHNDLNAIMRDISKRMSHEDMVAVANYMQGLY